MWRERPRRLVLSASSLSLRQKVRCWVMASSGETCSTAWKPRTASPPQTSTKSFGSSASPLATTRIRRSGGTGARPPRMSFQLLREVAGVVQALQAGFRPPQPLLDLRHTTDAWPRVLSLVPGLEPLVPRLRGFDELDRALLPAGCVRTLPHGSPTRARWAPAHLRAPSLPADKIAALQIIKTRDPSH